MIAFRFLSRLGLSLAPISRLSSEVHVLMFLLCLLSIVETISLRLKFPSKLGTRTYCVRELLSLIGPLNLHGRISHERHFGAHLHRPMQAAQENRGELRPEV